MSLKDFTYDYEPIRHAGHELFMHVIYFRLEGPIRLRSPRTATRHVRAAARANTGEWEHIFSAAENLILKSACIFFEELYLKEPDGDVTCSEHCHGNMGAGGGRRMYETPYKPPLANSWIPFIISGLWKADKWRSERKAAELNDVSVVIRISRWRQALTIEMKHRSPACGRTSSDIPKILEGNTIPAGRRRRSATIYDACRKRPLIYQ